MINVLVLKAFLFDLVTTAITVAAAWLAIPDNVSKLGVGDAFVPIVVGIAGAAVIAARRYLIEAKK